MIAFPIPREKKDVDITLVPLFQVGVKGYIANIIYFPHFEIHQLQGGRGGNLSVIVIHKAWAKCVVDSFYDIRLNMFMLLLSSQWKWHPTIKFACPHSIHMWPIKALCQIASSRSLGLGGKSTSAPTHQPTSLLGPLGIRECTSRVPNVGFGVVNCKVLALHVVYPCPLWNGKVCALSCGMSHGSCIYWVCCVWGGGV